VHRRVSLATAVLAMVLVSLLFSPACRADASGTPWLGTDDRGQTTVRLFFFWTETCPHCERARPFVDGLAAELDWLEVLSLALSEDRPGDVDFFLQMSQTLGESAPGVPAFVFCGRMVVGFGSEETSGAALRHALLSCHAAIVTTGTPWAAAPGSQPLVLPFCGAVDPQTVSLPLFTVMIAAVDAFNPCAFFVLMFLMSLLAHARNRRKMAVVGGVFVLTSGLLYFAFMAAWLNVFLLMGELRWVTTIAALIAIALAALNIKDYVWFRRGVSLGIPETAKPALFARMRALMLAESWPVLLAGTLALAVAANTYELLCTAGFPMLFTRVLTLREMSGSAYYLYLALYNVVYVIPLLGIATAFLVTLGSRKLQRREGRILKLLSGLMMLGLGLALLLRPDWLVDLRAAGGIVLAAVIGAGLITILDRRRLTG
jgi:hypothetical protein